MKASKDRSSYLGITIIALIAGSLVVLNTVKVGRQSFQLLENRFPGTFDQIVSGENKAFTVGGIVTKPVQRLEFRFSYLVSSAPPPVGLVPEDANQTQMYMGEIEPLLDLSLLWDEPPEVVDTETQIAGESLRVVIYDFTRLLNATGQLRKHSETLTTFAFVLNSSGALKGYYKGVSGFMFQNRTGARMIHLSLMADESKQEYYEAGLASAYKAPSLAEGPKLGMVVFHKPAKGTAVRVTFTVETGYSPERHSLQVVRVYVDTVRQVCQVNWVAGAAG